MKRAKITKNLNLEAQPFTLSPSGDDIEEDRYGEGEGEREEEEREREGEGEGTGETLNTSNTSTDAPLQEPRNSPAIQDKWYQIKVQVDDTGPGIPLADQLRCSEGGLRMLGLLGSSAH